MNKLFELKFGSHLYGTNTPDSDLDYKAIYVPSAKDIVLGSYKETITNSRPKTECERNNKDDIDMEIFSLDRYLDLLMQGQTVALDILFAPEDMFIFGYNNEVMNIIRKNKDKFLTKNVNAFVGYARQQAAKYGIKGSRMDALKRTMEVLDRMPHLHDKLFQYEDMIYNLVFQTKELVSLEKTSLIEVVMLPGPNKIDLMPHLHVCGRKVPFGATVKFARDVFSRILEEYGNRARKAHLDGGVDWKALSHAVRVNTEALELLSTGNITFPRPDRELLINIKTGKLRYEQVAEMIEQGLADLYIAHEKSTLRETPDYLFANGLIYDVYSEMVIDERSS